MFFPGRFLAYCDSNVVLAFLDLSLFFIAFCFQFVCDVHKENIGGHQVVADLLFFFLNKCAWKNTLE